MLMVSRHGCVGGRISLSSSFDVGIQNERRPFSTSDKAAKSRISSNIARKPYGFFGGKYPGSLMPSQ
jgi:hypothetical protein